MNDEKKIQKVAKRRFIRLKYVNESTKPYVMAFELPENKMPSRENILFSGSIQDISVNGLKLYSEQIKDIKQFVGKDILFLISFQNTNFQRWVCGKVLYGNGNKLSVTLSKVGEKNIYFTDGTFCKTQNLIPIEVLSKEQKFLSENEQDRTWLTENCKSNINSIFEQSYSSNRQLIFDKSLYSIINGVIQTYFFQNAKAIIDGKALQEFVSTLNVSFENKIDYAITFSLSCMRKEHIYIPQNFGNKGKLFPRVLSSDDKSYLFQRRWEGKDLLDTELIEKAKTLGEIFFKNGLINYHENLSKLFPNPNLRAAGNAYVEQLSMYMEGRQKEVNEIIEFSVNDFTS